MLFRSFCTVGAPLAGYLSDRAVRLRRERRGGVWVPEDRLHATLWGAAVLVPVSVLVEALAVEYVPGIPGIVLIVCSLFANGVAVRRNLPSLEGESPSAHGMMLFRLQLLVVVTPSMSYFVDILHNRSAESMVVAS